MILDNRVAIVTASGSGIGRAGARKMAREGAIVIVADISAERSAETVAGIRASGGRAEARPTDVTDGDAVRRLVENTLSAHGRIDILHSHAGVQVEGGVEDLETAGLDRSHAVNVRAHFELSKSVVPTMRAQGGGVILLTSSNAGVMPDYGMLAYLTTEAATVCPFGERSLLAGSLNPAVPRRNYRADRTPERRTSHRRSSRRDRERSSAN